MSFSSPQSVCLPVLVHRNGPRAAHRFLNSVSGSSRRPFHFEMPYRACNSSSKGNLKGYCFLLSAEGLYPRVLRRFHHTPTSAGGHREVGRFSFWFCDVCLHICFSVQTDDSGLENVHRNSTQTLMFKTLIALKYCTCFLYKEIHQFLFRKMMHLLLVSPPVCEPKSKLRKWPAPVILKISVMFWSGVSFMWDSFRSTTQHRIRLLVCPRLLFNTNINLGAFLINK